MEAAKHIPENAIIIEISPDGQMQSILKQSHEEATYIALSKRGHNDPVIFLLEAIGEWVNSLNYFCCYLPFCGLLKWILLSARWALNFVGIEENWAVTLDNLMLVQVKSVWVA